jgi:hypothetical protein
MRPIAARASGRLRSGFRLPLSAISLLKRRSHAPLFHDVTRTVRLQFVLVEDLAQRALRQIGEAGVSRRRPTLTRMTRQQPRRPQFMRITEFLRFTTRKRNQPAFGFVGNAALPAGSGEIGERFSAPRRETLSRAPLRHGNHARSLPSEVEKTTRVNFWKRHLRYFAPLRASVLFTPTRGGMKQKYLPPRGPS